MMVVFVEFGDLVTVGTDCIVMAVMVSMIGTWDIAVD